MRIGIYDPYLDDAGGGEKYMMTIAECLSKNHDVDIFWDDKQDIKIISDRFGLDLSKTRLVKNIFSKDTSIVKRIPETKKYDALIILSDGSIPLTLSKKTFIHIQQPLPHISPNLRSGLKLKKINAVFCNSQFTKSFIDKELNIKSFVLYPPVDIKMKNLKKENIILTVGRFRAKDVITGIDDYKKLPVMINAFKTLVKAGLKNWKFILAVSVKDKDKDAFWDLEKVAEDFPIEFLVNKSNDELWESYSKAKIYWHASGFGEDLNVHPEFAEHFGISTVEAMGAGAVPVVINRGGQKEIVKEGITGFLWDTLEQLEQKTLELVGNDKLMSKLSGNAKEDSKNFSKQKFCDEINNLISK